MEIFLLTIIAAAVIFNIGTLIHSFNSKKTASILAERNENLNKSNNEQSLKIKNLEEQVNFLLIFKGRFEEAQQTISDLKSNLIHLQEQIVLLQQKSQNFEKERDLIKQEKQLLLQEKEEWNNKKQTILFQLSEELIKKNSAQAEDFGKQQKEIINQTVEQLNEKFLGLLNKVSSLDDDVKKTFQDINFTKNALLNPGGAGKIAEITLENILHASGLKEKNGTSEFGDFILQSHFNDFDRGAKRPDAIVFLPKNQLLIIDSKSSSHFLELQQALDENNQQNRKEIEGKIKESMKRHLEDLKKRDYATAKLEELNLKDLDDSQSQPIIITIMFLQTEKILELIRSLDPTFERKALEAGIQILSPTGLINLLYQAKFFIDNIRQEKNIEKLKIEIRKLMESIGTMARKSQEMGNSIHKSLKIYNEFVGTFNGRFLPRISNMNKLGIESEDKNIEKLRKIDTNNGLIEASAILDEDL